MASICGRDGYFGVVVRRYNEWNAMGRPIKKLKRRPPPKGGEVSATTGLVRRPNAAPANPVADQRNWRVKLLASRIKFDDRAKEIFLRDFADHGRKKEAANVAGVSLLTVTNHCKNDPDFAQAFDEAQAEYRDKFVKRAIDEIAYQGIAINKVNPFTGDVYEERREHPVRLLELELRRIDPTFRDKHEISLTGGGGILVVPAAMTPAEWVADQEKKNEARKNPLLAEDKGKTTSDAEATKEVDKEVVLPDRAKDVAARKAGKAVTR